MITIDKLTQNLKTYITTQIDTMSKNTPMISFMKPLITRALDKNFNKITKALDLIADENGNIDIENIEISIMSTKYIRKSCAIKTNNYIPYFYVCTFCSNKIGVIRFFCGYKSYCGFSIIFIGCIVNHCFKFANKLFIKIII